jgi:hypothetical protein
MKTITLNFKLRPMDTPLLENLVLTCLPCNYDRGGFTLEEMGL